MTPPTPGPVDGPAADDDSAAGAGLAVSGGAGGTAAMLEDLDTAATALADAGARLDLLAGRLRLLITEPWLFGVVILSPLTAIQLEVALVRAAYGPSGLVTSARAVGGLAVALHAAVRLYRGADALVAGLLNGLELMAGMAIGRMVSPLVLFGDDAVVAATLGGAAASGRGGTDAASSESAAAQRPPGHASAPSGSAGRFLEYIGSVPGCGDQLIGVVPGILAGSMSAFGGAGVLALIAAGGPRSTLRAVTAVAPTTPWLVESGRVRARTSAPRAVRAPSGVGDLVGRTAELSPGAGGPAATLRIDRVVARDGSRSWIVHVPGTQEWSPRAGTNPFDLTTDTAAFAGRVNAAGALVVAGLRSTGARPGEPILLSGHSLGGIASAELAADPLLRKDFSISHVVSVGAPTALAGVPRTVSTLAVEHAQDPVPWLDGEPSPDGANRVTVRRAVDDPLHAHDGQEYARTGTMIDASDDASLARWRETLTPFLDGPGRTTTSWEVTGERLP